MPTPEQQAALDALVVACGGPAIRPNTTRRGGRPPQHCFACGGYEGKLKRLRAGRSTQAWFHPACHKRWQAGAAPVPPVVS